MAFNFALHVCLHAQHLLVVVFGEVILAENSVEVYIAVVREGVGAFSWGRRGLGGGSSLLRRFFFIIIDKCYCCSMFLFFAMSAEGCLRGFTPWQA